MDDAIELDHHHHHRDSHHNTKDASTTSTQSLVPTVSRLGHDFDLESSRTRSLSRSRSNNSRYIVQEELPPVDGGRAAWVYLTVAFLIEALCWGFAFSFGVFQEYYSSNELFAESSGIPLIGTLCTGIPYLGSPFMFQLCARFPNQRKNMLRTGMASCIVGCVGASFATKTWHLIMTQGALYGLGTMMLYVSVYAWMNEWFVARRGLAVGIIYSGSGISGLILPFVLSFLLQHYSFRTVLRIWSVFLAITLTPAIYFVRGRLPASQVVITRKISTSFLRHPSFYVFTATNLLQGLGYFLPSLYLPSYATSLSLSPTSGTLVLALLNLATVIGQILLGWSSDMVDVHHILFISCFTGGLSALLLWGFSKGLPLLICFSVVYGVTAGGYSVLWSRFASRVVGREDDAGWMVVFGVFAAQKGVGNILSGPISSVLLGGEEIREDYAVGRYEGMVVFVGITMVISALGWGGTFLKR